MSLSASDDFVRIIVVLYICICISGDLKQRSIDFRGFVISNWKKSTHFHCSNRPKSCISFVLHHHPLLSGPSSTNFQSSLLRAALVHFTPFMFVIHLASCLPCTILHFLGHHSSNYLSSVLHATWPDHCHFNLFTRFVMSLLTYIHKNSVSYLSLCRKYNVPHLLSTLDLV